VAVTEVSKIVEASGSLDFLGRLTASESWKVVCSAKTDTVVAVLTASGLPQPGDIVTAGGTKVFFQRSSATRETVTASGGAVWRVTVDYGPADYSEANPPGPPTSWPIKYRWESEEFERPAVRDVSGAALVNSAGQPPGDPWMVEDSRRVLTVVRNELVETFDPILADSFGNKLNAATWNGAAAKTVKAKPIVTSDPIYSQDLEKWYFEVTYRFHYKSEGWQARFVDQGYAELVSGSPPKLQTIRDKDGQDLKEPALLNGSGVRLTNPSPGNEVYRLFDVYPTADFSLLSINLATALGR
jgi:hypothetical protein